MSRTGTTIVDFREYQRRKAGVVKGVGLCAASSPQGDWAFDYALFLARHYETRLNIFHFLESPYTLRRDVVFVDEEKTRTAPITPDLIAKMDKEMREKYDDRLGDFVEAGFRLCEGNDKWELRKCFKRGDYEVLVIGYKAVGANFGGTTTIEAFAEKFEAPVVLIGPDSPESFHINEPAEKRVSKLLIPVGLWKRIRS